MKHLKKFRLFESVSGFDKKTKEEVIDDIKQIFLSELEDTQLRDVNMNEEPTGKIGIARLIPGKSAQCWKDNSDLEVIPMSVDDDVAGYGQPAMYRCRINELYDFIFRLLKYKEDNSIDLEIETVGLASHKDEVITLENLPKLCGNTGNGTPMILRALSIRVNIVEGEYPGVSTEQLKTMLSRAVGNEDYEEAAKLSREIKSRNKE